MKLIYFWLMTIENVSLSMLFAAILYRKHIYHLILNIKLAMCIHLLSFMHIE